MSAAPDDTTRSLARWVEPPVPAHGAEAQTARQWAAIRERREARRKSPFRIGWWAAGGGLGGLIAVAAVLLVMRPWARDDGSGWERGAVVSSAPGAVIESGAEPIAVHLADGSQIDLEADTRLEAARLE
ncbi:MAG: hypothetical protein M3Y87_21855, partial [Myxococcota bacterium]|nr:hypothetical protein [Myxococcota bacterium]